MKSQIRDTHFGHLLRFLTSNAILQFPDELDLARCVHALKAKNSRGDSWESKIDDIEANVESGNEACLVDWYRPDDPEV